MIRRFAFLIHSLFIISLSACSIEQQGSLSDVFIRKADYSISFNDVVFDNTNNTISFQGVTIKNEGSSVTNEFPIAFFISPDDMIFNSDDALVGVEGELKGRGPSRKKQVAIMGAATAAGAAGGVGTAIAAGAGGAIAAFLLPRGKQASLTAGSLVGMRLDRDVTFSLPAQNN